MRRPHGGGGCPCGLPRVCLVYNCHQSLLAFPMQRFGGTAENALSRAACHVSRDRSARRHLFLTALPPQRPIGRARRQPVACQAPLLGGAAVVAVSGPPLRTWLCGRTRRMRPRGPPGLKRPLHGSVRATRDRRGRKVHPCVGALDGGEAV